MTAGATFAQEHPLRPGIALSPEQVAHLTSDIGWLQAREVTPRGVVLTTGGAALSAAVATGVSTLASQAAVSFINNQGNLGETLQDLGSKDGVKNLLTAMLTAGAVSSLGNTTFFGDKPLNQITAADGFGAHLGKSVVNNVANATMTSALTGASLQDSIKSALTSAFISAGAGQTANSIGDLTPDSPYLNALAHALAGCVAGAAGQGGSAGCTAGASGAVVGELAAQWINPTGDLSKSADTLAFASLMAGLAGALTGDGSAASVNNAANAGANAALNNYLSHEESSRRLRLQSEKLACKTDVCRQETQVEIDRLNRLDTWRDQQIEQACKSPASAACQSWSAAISVAAASYEGQRGNLVDLAERSSVSNKAYEYRQAANNPFMHGVGTGLLKLTPPGLAVGVVGGIASTVQSITDNGLAQTLIDSVSAIANLPSELRSRLNSSDPTVRGEALVDVITLGSGVSVIGAGGVRLTLDEAQAAQVSRAVAKAEEGAVARARIDNNFSADMPGLGTSAVRDFKPGTTHRAENINAGQLTDRDGFQRVDRVEEINTAQVREALQGTPPQWWGTQRPAWKEGTMVTDRVTTVPETYRMVVDQKAYKSIVDAISDGKFEEAAQNLGAWPGRNGDPMYVVEFTVKPGVGVREGTVGSMFDAKIESTLPGGGHQVQFLENTVRTFPGNFVINPNSLKRVLS